MATWWEGVCVCKCMCTGVGGDDDSTGWIGLKLKSGGRGEKEHRRQGRMEHLSVLVETRVIFNYHILLLWWHPSGQMNPPWTFIPCPASCYSNSCCWFCAKHVKCLVLFNPYYKPVRWLLPYVYIFPGCISCYFLTLIECGTESTASSNSSLLMMLACHAVSEGTRWALVSGVLSCSDCALQGSGHGELGSCGH